MLDFQCGWNFVMDKVCLAKSCPAYMKGKNNSVPIQNGLV